VLEFIKEHLREYGSAPSYEAIANGLGMSSKSNIHRIVHRLQVDGYLFLKPYKFRSIKVVDRSAKMMSML
jgi:SOS-response transcriptional repressor LexA